MNILFACDSSYAFPLTVCLVSILENNKQEKIQIYILYSTLLEEQKIKLNKLAQSYAQHIYLIHIEDSYFNTAPVLRWSKETYYRLLINEVLPFDLERILYLDCDIIADASLSELYGLNLEKNYLAAFDISDDMPMRERLGLNPNGKYFQAGVILFDLNKSRKLLSYKKVLDVLKILGDRLLAVDQDVINIIFDGKIKPIEQRFNDSTITKYKGTKNYPEKTVLFHYATGKPWNRLYSGRCEKIWYKYLLLSPYKSLYTNKYNTLQYRILRMRVFKALFYEYIHLTPFINKITLSLLPSKTYTTLKKYYRKWIK